MTDLDLTPNLDDLRRELDQLVLDVLDDADPNDHRTGGRWPAIHRLALRVDEMESAMAERRG